MKWNWGIFKSTVSAILAFSLGIGMVGSRGFAISDEEKADVIKRAEQYLKDNGVRFSKENSSVEKNAKDNEANLVDPDEVDKFLEENKNYFPDKEIFSLRKEILKLTRKEFLQLKSLSFRSPAIMCLISFFLGWTGLDRFLLKDIPLGVLKLLGMTFFGGVGFAIGAYIFSWIDVFLTWGNTKEYNLKMVLEAIAKV